MVSALVSYEDYEGAMVFLDIIVDEDRKARIELLAHAQARKAVFHAAKCIENPRLSEPKPQAEKI